MKRDDYEKLIMERLIPLIVAVKDNKVLIMSLKDKTGAEAYVICHDKGEDAEGHGYLPLFEITPVTEESGFDNEPVRVIDCSIQVIPLKDLPKA